MNRNLTSRNINGTRENMKAVKKVQIVCENTFEILFYIFNDKC